MNLTGMTDRAWRKRTLRTGLACLLGVLLVSWAGLASYGRFVGIREEGLVVPGTVVAADNGGKVVHVEIEFVTLDGEQVRTQAFRPYWTPAPVGEAWQVRYNPHDPWSYPEDVRVPAKNLPVAVVMAILVVLAMIGGWAAYARLGWMGTPAAAARWSRR